MLEASFYDTRINSLVRYTEFQFIVVVFIVIWLYIKVSSTEGLTQQPLNYPNLPEYLRFIYFVQPVLRQVCYIRYD